MRDSLHSVEDWIRYGDELRRPLLVGPNLAQSTKLYVIGAGLSGLTIAYRIAAKRPDIEIEIIEKKNRCGGTIETWSEGQWSCDVAVNAARPHPAFWRLVDDLELGVVFSGSNPKASSRWILNNGKKSKLSLFSALRMGPFRLLKTIRASRNGGVSVAEVLPDKSIADAMTLGIVNDLSHHVDADFLMPSLTKFGQTPPLKWSHIKKKMMKTYPLFTPKKGSIASFEGGMQTLIDALVDKVSQLPNITFHFGEQFDTPQQVASERNAPIRSVIWCGPLTRTPDQFTQLDIYAVGYSEKNASNVPIGYGTLIPDKSVPISGILHESDVHQSSRAPSGYRLFRIMAPKDRGGELDSIAESLKDILCESEPTLLKKIGERQIPSYPPGYMEALNLNGSEFTRAGWFSSGVSVTHVVAEAERIADLF